MTIAGDTIKDDVVTVRHRDSMTQDKVKVRELRSFIGEAMRNWKRPARARVEA